MQKYLRIRWDGPHGQAQWVKVADDREIIWDGELVSIPSPKEAFLENGFNVFQAEVLVDHIDYLLHKGEKISAIKVVRLFTNRDEIGLREAKQIIDAYTGLL